MSKYHNVKLDGEEFIVRDVTMYPFSKKYRVAPISLKEKILDKRSRNEDLNLTNYINRRIHFYVNPEFVDLSDDELSQYLESNLYDVKNDMN